MDKRLEKLTKTLKNSSYKKTIVKLDAYINNNTRTRDADAISHLFHNAILSDLFLIYDKPSNDWRLNGSQFKVNISHYLYTHGKKNTPLRKIERILKELIEINLLEGLVLKESIKGNIYYNLKLNSKTISYILRKEQKGYKSYKLNEEDWEWRSEVDEKLNDHEKRIFNLESKVASLEKEGYVMGKELDDLKEQLRNSIPKENMYMFLLKIQAASGLDPSEIQEIYDETIKKE